MSKQNTLAFKPRWLLCFRPKSVLGKDIKIISTLLGWDGQTLKSWSPVESSVEPFFCEMFQVKLKVCNWKWMFYLTRHSSQLKIEFEIQSDFFDLSRHILWPTFFTNWAGWNWKSTKFIPHHQNSKIWRGDHKFTTTFWTQHQICHCSKTEIVTSYLPIPDFETRKTNVYTQV